MLISNGVLKHTCISSSQVCAQNIMVVAVVCLQHRSRDMQQIRAHFVLFCYVLFCFVLFYREPIIKHLSHTTAYIQLTHIYINDSPTFIFPALKHFFNWGGIFIMLFILLHKVILKTRQKPLYHLL